MGGKGTVDINQIGQGTQQGGDQRGQAWGQDGPETGSRADGATGGGGRLSSGLAGL